jgi:outer membrane protein OmpA-like peptidoglycan-associated protein
MLQGPEMTSALADELFKAILADRVNAEKIGETCYAMLLLPPALRSRNVEVRSLVTKTLTDASVVLWEDTFQLNPLPTPVRIGADADTVSIESAVVRWSRLIESHCEMLGTTSPKSPPITINLPTAIQPPPSTEPPLATLPDLYFAFGSPKLLPGAFATLDSIVNQLRDGPIEIDGYTDSIGTRPFNLELSLRRANSVRVYLENRGLDTANLITRGLGAENPVASNDTEEGRAQNRRVIIRKLPRGG